MELKERNAELEAALIEQTGRKRLRKSKKGIKGLAKSPMCSPHPRIRDEAASIYYNHAARPFMQVDARTPIMHACYIEIDH